MRQFISPRFWLSIAALVGLSYGLWYVLLRHDDSVAVIGRPATAAVDEHRVNLLLPVYSVQADPGFVVTTGVTSTDMQLALDATRVMTVKAGTPGQITCAALAEINQCLVAADLLGDAVVWFSLIPNPQRASLLLPGVTEVRKDNWVLLSNGWEVARNEVVERNCDATGLEDFVRQFGGSLSTSTFSFEQQEITKVTCLEQPETSTTSTSTTTTIAVPVVIPVDTSVITEDDIPVGEVPVDGVPPAAPIDTVGP